MASVINNFNQKGTTNVVPQKSTSIKLAQNPKPIRARLSESGGVAGSKVKVTNSKAAGGLRQRRTASLGMGGVGQRGRSEDF